VEKSAVIEAIDADTIYDVPLLMSKEKLDTQVITKLRLKDKKEPDLVAWKGFLGKLKNPVHEVHIGLVGKYNELQDAYKSIYEAFIHAGAMNECEVHVEPIHSEQLEGDYESVVKRLKHLDGILVAPGFGERGIEGKIKAIKYVRENPVHPLIDLMPDQVDVQKGGTMRLGAYACTLRTNSKSAKAYGSTTIQERHRHRYEFNNEYLEVIEKGGLVPVGINPETSLVEVVELEGHPWFVGVQYHPELKSTVENPHPLFVGFVHACLK